MWTKDENKWVRIIGCGKIGCCGTCDERLGCKIQCSKSEGVKSDICDNCTYYMDTLLKKQ